MSVSYIGSRCRAPCFGTLNATIRMRIEIYKFYKTYLVLLQERYQVSANISMKNRRKTQST